MSVLAEVNHLRDKTMIDKVINSVFGKIGLVILTTLAYTAIIPLVFLVNQTILHWALKWVTLMMIALIAGISSRLLLKGMNGILVLMIAIIAWFISLLMLNQITNGYMGINYQHGLFDYDWLALSQLLSAGLVLLFSLKAWKITVHPRRSSNKPTKRHSYTSKSKKPKIKSYSKSAGNNNQTLSRRPYQKRQRSQSIQKNGSKFLPMTIEQLKRKTRSLISSTRAAWQQIEPKFNSPSLDKTFQIYRKPLKISSTTKKKRAKKDIQLSGQVEHRCPYCLEIVDPDDPGGAVECPICHTLHHADCWAITGTCQVPHHIE